MKLLALGLNLLPASRVLMLDLNALLTVERERLCTLLQAPELQQPGPRGEAALSAVKREIRCCWTTSPRAR